MATLLSLKRRINTAKNVSKTTKAMQMIAASKLKKSQNAALFSRPYVQKLTSLCENLTAKIEKDDYHIFMKKNRSQNNMLLVVAPDRGLCGGLITNMNRELLKFNDQYKNTSYISIGRKAEHVVLKLRKEILASFPIGTTLPSFDMVYPIAKIIEEQFLNEKVGSVKILYNDFTSVFNQTPTIITLLPITLEGMEKNNSNTIFEPNLNALMPSLLNHYLEMKLHQVLLEGFASEQAARMIAMKNATDNALDVIDELQLEYNKLRQEKITNEILDIGGANISYAN